MQLMTRTSLFAAIITLSMNAMASIAFAHAHPEVRPSPASSDENTQLWQSLQGDSARTVQSDDPFTSLKPEQLDSLGFISYVRNLQETHPEAVHPLDIEEAAELSAALTEQGVEIDKLIGLTAATAASRTQVAEQLNHNLNGESITLTGFAIPIESKHNKVTRFLLLANSQTCIHDPLPDVNQMVMVSAPDGIALDGLNVPIEVSGHIAADKQQHEVYLGDGFKQFATGYRLESTSSRTQ